MKTILNNFGDRIKVSDMQFDDLILSAQYGRSNSTIKIKGEFVKIPLGQFQNR